MTWPPMFATSNPICISDEIADMFIAVTIALLITMALTLARALLGPTLFDRLLAVNSFGTKTVLAKPPHRVSAVMAVHGFMTGRPDFLDIALVYSLINFIGTIAVLKFFEYDDLGSGAYQEDDF